MRTIIAVLTWAVTAHPLLRTQDATAQSVAQLPVELREVQSVGRWRDDSWSGVYRIVVARAGYETIANRLYIQGIHEGLTGERHVVATTSVTEINDGAPLTLTLSPKFDGTNQLRVIANTHNSVTGQRQQLVLVATTPATYRVLKPQSGKSR
jgi:hypothetical protein